MLTYRDLSYQYPNTSAPILQNLNLDIPEGDFVLVVGPSGAGKSTFLRTINGLVPHFYGGAISGSVRVGGRNPVQESPRGMSDLVGMVFQDPESSFVVDVVEDELAFAMENWGLPQDVMRKRVEEALDQLQIAHLRQRPISQLSGGEKQRVAIAAVLTLHPDILVLDEPTSQLDPQAAEEVLQVLRQLNEDLGLTILLSEHRLERVAHYVDSILYWPGQGRPPLFGPPAQILQQIPLTPPLITLGKALDWQPLPLTIKQGRKFARKMSASLRPAPLAEPARVENPPSVFVKELWHRYESGQEALRGISLQAGPGDFIALMGRNGSGKTTLLKHLIGLLKPQRGEIRILGMNPAQTPTETLTRSIAYLLQNPERLLFAESVADELAFSRRAHQLPPDPDADLALLARLGLQDLLHRHPHDLSVGEKQRLALAAILIPNPQVLLLDEPTRGLDYVQKQHLARILQALQAEGKTILMATHDVELAAQATNRVILMAQGEVVVQGPSRRIMSESLLFSSQINKLFRSPHYLTPDDVLQALPNITQAKSAAATPSYEHGPAHPR